MRPVEGSDTLDEEPSSFERLLEPTSSGDTLSILPLWVYSQIASLAVAALGLVASVSAHGYVTENTVGGVKYTGYQPYSDLYCSVPPARIIRRSDDGSVTDVSLIDVQCNGYSAGGVVGSAPAPLIASAAPESTVTFHWTEWPDFYLGPFNIAKWLPGNAAVWFRKG